MFKGYMQFVGWFVFVKYDQGSFIYICKTQYCLLPCIFAQIDLCLCVQTAFCLFASRVFLCKADWVCLRVDLSFTKQIEFVCKMLDLFV